MNRMKQLLGAVAVVGTLLFSMTQLSAQRSRGDDTYIEATSAVVNRHMVKLEKTGPSVVSLNDDFTYVYTVTVKEDVDDVVVEDTIPLGTTYVASTPSAQINEDQILWSLGPREEGDVVELKLILNAAEATDYASCPDVTAYCCTITSVGVPQLLIENTVDPDRVLVNSAVPWDVVVTNAGNYPAYDVVMTDSLPDNIVHDSGKSTLAYNIGTLDPGESYQTTIDTTALEAGEYTNVAIATSSNADAVQDDANVVVLNSGIEVFKDGPESYFVGKPATYNIVARNTGDIDFYDVEIVDQVPATTNIVSAPGADISGDRAVWTTDLPAGQEKSFKILVVGTEEGTYYNEVTASSDEYGLSSSDTAGTSWRGYPALLVEVIDTDDPLLIGEQTNYYIDIVNQGSASDTNVVLDVEVSDGLSIISAKGETEGRISGNKIVFDPYPVLKAKKRIKYRIVAQGNELGDLRFTVKVKSDILKQPVTEEESTQVY